jgi:type I restriction enzyme S subunit
VGLLPGKKVTTEYVRYWFVAMEKTIDAAATQVAQKNINLELLRSLDILVPPKQALERFTHVAKHARQIKRRLKAMESEAVDLCESLIQRACLGEL